MAYLIGFLAAIMAAQVFAQPLRQWSASNLAWLQQQVTPNRAVPDPDPSRRRLLISYQIEPAKFPTGFSRSAVYDNALAALALLATGRADEAAFTLHALARLTRPDGSLWFGYNTANNWPDESDHHSATVRAGSVGWAGYSLAFYLANALPCPPANEGCSREKAFFLETAGRLANYLLSLEVREPDHPCRGLLRLGHGSIQLRYREQTNEVVEIYLDQPARSISTENNISAWYFLRLLGSQTGEARWSQAAERIRLGLLRGAWNPQIGQFNQGFSPAGEPDAVKALDCASWGCLFLLSAGDREKARKATAAVETYFASRDGEAAGYRPYFDVRIFPNLEVGRFFFPDNPARQWRDLPLVWSEGTLGAALAFARLGEAERARRAVEGLRALQAAGSGLRYASRAVPHEMSDAPSVAAASWLVLLAESVDGNPMVERFLR